MSKLDERLSEIRATLDNGVVPTSIPVRDFLWWFSAERRGYNIVQRIRRHLERHGLVTYPDFEYTYIGGEVSFRLSLSSTLPGGGGKGAANREQADPTFRVGQLEAANRPPEFVAPDCSIPRATTLLLGKRVSQLPVMTDQRTIKGQVNWKTIATSIASGNPATRVGDCMESIETVAFDAPLFSAVQVIVEKGCVLVRGKDRTVSGIITASDLSLQFRQMAEPFLLIGEIENHIRRMIYGKFEAEELRDAASSREANRSIDTVSDLSFGEYVRLIEKPERWGKLGLELIDRVVFVEQLNEIRRLRNDVMHFSPDGLSQGDVDEIGKFAAFMRDLGTTGEF